MKLINNMVMVSLIAGLAACGDSTRATVTLDEAFGNATPQTITEEPNGTIELDRYTSFSINSNDANINISANNQAVQVVVGTTGSPSGNNIQIMDGARVTILKLSGSNNTLTMLDDTVAYTIINLSGSGNRLIFKPNSRMEINETLSAPDFSLSGENNILEIQEKTIFHKNIRFTISGNNNAICSTTSILDTLKVAEVNRLYIDNGCTK